ncbi:glycosyltransferase family 4 protein [Streptomyces sp. NPDC050418]|uniref:glycosyltransferase family 4 protein n=1 Tax=Streptomyces sp. NPDC050418 TaxID=3365612 RepID=UPI0037B026C1
MTGSVRRVLFVSHFYPPHMGGIERVVQAEAVRLARLGLDVTVVTSGERSSETVEDGVRVVRVRAWNGFESRLGVPFPLFGPGLMRTMKVWARRSDVVHLHDTFYLTSWAGAFAARRARRPWLVTQHVELVDHPSKLVTAVQRAVYRLAGARIWRGARTVFTLNDRVAGFVRGHGVAAERMRHLPNGVDTELYRPRQDDLEQRGIRAEFGLPADRPLALFAGRLVPKKGYDIALAARALTDGFDLVLAGGGDASAATGGEGVHYVGALPPERLARLYRACDMFVLPSVAEGFPLSVQEAMASGLPVVTTPDPGYAPYGLDTERFVFAERTPQQVAAALSRLAADPTLRTEMAKYSAQYAQSAFSWDTHAQSLIEQYEEAAEPVRR